MYLIRPVFTILKSERRVTQELGSRDETDEVSASRSGLASATPAAAQSLEDPWTALISRTVAVISEDDDMGDGTIPEVCTSSDPYSRFPSLNDESLRNSAREMKSARRRPAEVASRLRLPPQLRAWRTLGLL